MTNLIGYMSLGTAAFVILATLFAGSVVLASQAGLFG